MLLMLVKPRPPLEIFFQNITVNSDLLGRRMV